MGKRGPKPKPTPLKILEGYKPYQINKDEPVIPVALLEAPDWLDTYGLEHWQELAPMLARAGLLTEGDRPALAQMCDDFSTIRKSIDGPDEIAGDFDRMRSLMTSADKARDRYRRMLIEFGLTPSSRSRIKAPAEKPKDELDVFEQEFKKA